MWIDSHCHLIHKRLLNLGGPEKVVENAGQAGIDAMVTICCDIAHEFPEVLSVARQFGNVWCTIGTHPHDAGVPEEKAITLEKLVELASSDSNIIGIGESGLDYYYKNSEPEDQQESFRKHIRACIETDLPLVVHARDADDDIIRIMREEGQGTKLKGVMHCFSSSRKLGEEALDFGFYISFSGIVTFKNSQDLRDFAKDVPLDKMLVETDAPFLAPEPHRGQINEPALVPHTGAVLAGIKDVSEAELAARTTENFFTLFDKAKLQ
ncbi:MAG: TatD family hydrolase [Rhodospirillales bacterium]|nr:TatD family hydrolase [Rhodospirillales bacterium]